MKDFINRAKNELAHSAERENLRSKSKTKARLLIATLLLAVGTSVWAQNNAVAIFQTNGQVATYLFTETPRVTYKGDCLLMSSGSGTVQYSLRNIQSVALVDASNITGIDQAVQSGGTHGVVFHFIFGRITISNAAPSEKVSVYDINGKCLVEQTADAQGRCTLSTHALLKGVYVVQIGKTSYKIVK